VLESGSAVRTPQEGQVVGARTRYAPRLERAAVAGQDVFGPPGPSGQHVQIPGPVKIGPRIHRDDPGFLLSVPVGRVVRHEQQEEVLRGAHHGGSRLGK